MNEALQEACRNVLELRCLTVILVSAFYGIFVGSIPGLTATMAVALIVPLTFFLPDIQAIAAIVTTVTCSIFAGDIPATLVRIPGTPASAAYVDDAYSLTRQGRPERALTISLVFSVLGGLFGTLVLAMAAPQLAKVATRFTSYEYFWLFVLGLTCAAIVSDDSRLKGAFALLLGLLFSAVGLGTDYSVPRLTFGVDNLIEGINFIPAMIGLFGISEVLRNTMSHNRSTGNTELKTISTEPESEKRASTSVLEVVALLWKRPIAFLRSSVVGSFMGMLPGAGADIAAWISYALSKRFSRTPNEYGKGSEEGLADATGANNAALGSAWIPALVFGIPGDSVTAIAIGVLLMKNIQPGPDIFAVDSPQAVLVYGIFVTFVVANLIVIPLGLLAIRAGRILVRVPRSTLLPAIVLFCLVGSFALNGSYFDVAVMIAMGAVGYVLERYRIPLGPVVLGIILGGKLEHAFVQCLSKSASVLPFFSGSISLTLAIACFALWLAPIVKFFRGSQLKP